MRPGAWRVMHRVARQEPAEEPRPLAGAVGRCHRAPTAARAEEREGMDVAVHPGLGGRRRIGADEAGVAVRRGSQAKKCAVCSTPPMNTRSLRRSRPGRGRAGDARARTSPSRAADAPGCSPSRWCSRRRSRARRAAAQTPFAVWRCLARWTRSSRSHWSMILVISACRRYPDGSEKLSIVFTLSSEIPK